VVNGWGDHVKEGEMGRACCTCRGRFGWGKIKERDPSEKPDIDGRMML